VEDLGTRDSFSIVFTDYKQTAQMHATHNQLYSFPFVNSRL